MNRCCACGIELSEAMTLCPHHHFHDAGWAATNRIMCELLHRGLVPPRVPPADREEEFCGCFQEAA